MTRRPETGFMVSDWLGVWHVDDQQAQNNSLPQFSASPDLRDEFVAAVIGAVDSSADLSTQILNNSEIPQKLIGGLVPIIYKALRTTA